MSWLKKIGSVVLKITGLWQAVAPLVTDLLPGGSEVKAIINVIVTGEQMFAAAYGPDAKKGSDKLRAATPFVAQVIQASAFFQGKKLQNEALAADAFTRITAAFADLLNAYGD
jgi:hypothetical protein